MTMQVGMVGTDGVVLASDTLWRNDAGVRNTHHTSKIVVSPEHGIAVGCARSNISQLVADQIVTDGIRNLEDPCFELKVAAKKVMERTSNEPEAQCMVVLNKPSSIRLFALEMGSFGRNCCEITDKTLAGDTQNSATFFAERYYARRPIKELTLLAAHIVLTAAKLPGGMIDGLEILLCDAKGLAFVSEGDIRKLQVKSAALDESLCGWLAAPFL